MRRGPGIGKTCDVALYTVVPASTCQPWSAERVTTCPIAETRRAWVGEACGLHSTLGIPGMTMRDLVATPSAQCVEAVTVIHSELEMVRAQLRAPKD